MKALLEIPLTNNRLSYNLLAEALPTFSFAKHQQQQQQRKNKNMTKLLISNQTLPAFPQRCIFQYIIYRMGRGRSPCALAAVWSVIATGVRPGWQKRSSLLGGSLLWQGRRGGLVDESRWLERWGQIASEGAKGLRSSANRLGVGVGCVIRKS